MLLLVGGVGYFCRTATDRNVEDLWIRHWDEIDLPAIRRDYQPWTATQMHTMWEKKLIEKYGGSERFKQMYHHMDKCYPPRKYITRMLELGRPFVEFADYENALLEQRRWLFSTRSYFESLTPARKRAYLQQYGYPKNTSWHTYEEVLLKNDVVNSINFWWSKERDPYMNGTFTDVFNNK